MTSKLTQRRILIIGGVAIFLSVILGAFGAHGLKKTLDLTSMNTFETGVVYQFYHGIGLILVALISRVFDVRLNKSAYLFMLGICLFSFNCYLYALTQIKTIAMIIPLGGLSFIIGWLLFIVTILKSEKSK